MDEDISTGDRKPAAVPDSLRSPFRGERPATASAVLKRRGGVEDLSRDESPMKRRSFEEASVKSDDDDSSSSSSSSDSSSSSSSSTESVSRGSKEDSSVRRHMRGV